MGRRPAPDDRRAWQSHLTDKAQPVIDELTRIGAEFQAELTEGLDPKEAAKVSGILAQLRERLVAMDERRNDIARAS